MITAAAAAERIAARVAYVPRQNNDQPIELGVITAVGSGSFRWVFVRYDGDTVSKATDPLDLRWVKS